ncbi:FAD-dependent oxidoreductase, partial [Streptosporangium sp. NPDC006013]|uniref:NAD(P)/FAD-dependent oxidoreductase n=1 Tax=Streptosporangium sp. NPDC006013 TaxID=3155596 RepID=UPI0033A417FA
AAGLTAAEALRRKGFTGALTMVGEEPRLPYDRPPLSKQILRGRWEPDRVALRRHDALTMLGADRLLGIAATTLDADARKLTLSNGSVLAYDGLVIATGVTPRALPAGHELGGVHLLRTIDDALALRDGLLAATPVAIVGAGFLGSEVAAVARELGLNVTLIDPLPAPMIRQFGDHVAQLLAELNIQHGVRLRPGTAVTGLTSRDGQVTGVGLDNGVHVPADLVLVAIGSIPAVGWLADSGLNLGDGVQCDQRCQAAPGVLTGADREHAEVSMLALHLLQSSLVFINTQLLQAVLRDPKWTSKLTDEDRRALSPLFWTLVNPYGRFRLDMETRLDLGIEA